MIYLIGGPPRTGKTKIVTEVVRRKPMHAISTDAIRYMLRRSVPREALSPDLFLADPKEDLEYYRSGRVMVNQNAESVALWPYLEQIMCSYDEDGVDLLVEGVAILPAQVKALDIPHRTLIVGNTDASHGETVIAQARANEQDWMHNLTDERIAAYAMFFAHMSEWLRREADEHGVDYLDMHDATFVSDINRAVDALLSGHS